MTGADHSPRVSEQDRFLAVTSRNAEWMLGEMSFRLGAGQVTAQQRQEAAEVLTELADRLRASAPAVVIEAEQ